MKLQGSCHCGAVHFSVDAYASMPYMRCYCSICRKTAGGGGYAINLGAHAGTLEVEGVENITVYRARPAGAERRFCKICGSALWVWDASWPDLVHPFASAIDTALPEPPKNEHIMLQFKAPWVKVEAGPDDVMFQSYPDLSLADWHRKNAGKKIN